MNELKPREQRFVDRYVLHLNSARAAREVGYAPDSAHKTGWKLLQRPHIAEAISQRLDEIGEEHKGLQREIIRVLAAHLTTIPADIWESDGQGRLKLKPLAEIPIEAQLAMQISHKCWAGETKKPEAPMAEADEEDGVKEDDGEEGSQGGQATLVRLSPRTPAAKILAPLLGMGRKKDEDADEEERQRMKDAGAVLKERLEDMRQRLKSTTALDKQE